MVQEVQRCREVLPEESLTSVEHAAEKALMNGRVTWLVQGEPGLDLQLN